MPETRQTAGPAASRRRFRPGWQGFLLALLLAAGLVLSLQNLGHPSVAGYDEVFHAIVARNFIKHPLTPTLVDRPYVAADDRDWTQCHIWLHKPPLALWQIALTQKFLGVSNWTLRFPSVVQHLAACLLTFLLGRALFNRNVGLTAAAWQVVNPFFLTLVHGYQFCDHVDIALVFWTELAVLLLVYAVRRGNGRLFAAAGAAGGAAFLAKALPALLVPGLAAAFTLLVRLPPWRGRWPTVRWRHLAVLTLTFIVIAVPWNLYAYLRFRPSFLYEWGVIIGHLNTNVESWKEPWDAHLFHWLPDMTGPFLLPVLWSTIIVTVVALRRREMGSTTVALWTLGVVVPFSLAESKPIPMLAPALPAMALTVAATVREAWHARRPLLAAAWAAMAVALWWSPRPELHLRHAAALAPQWARSAAAGLATAAPALSRAPWIVAQAGTWSAIAAGAVLFAWLLWRLLPARLRPWVARLLLFVACLPLVPLTATYVKEAYAVTRRDREAPTWQPFAKRIREIVPANGLLLWTDSRDNAYLDLMYFSDRTVYSLHRSVGSHPERSREGDPYHRPLRALVKEAERNGAVVYLLSAYPRRRPVLLETDTPRRCTLVRLTPPPTRSGHD